MDNPNEKTDQIAARLLLPLEAAEASLDLVGGKGRALAAMASAGMQVPDGFHLTTSAYRQFVTENDLQQAILDLAKPALVESSVSFESAAVAIQALFEQADLPSEIIAEIQQAYDALNERGQAPAVAVRSSANAEDLPDLSFAGQQDTYLNVRGLNALVLAIRRCWASLWNARALGYRHQMDFSHNAVAMAVVVQRMVEAEVSGILFTANPTTGDRSELVVNASYGLGEAIVGGEVTPDTYVLERDSLNVKETIIGAKEQMFVSSSGQGTTAEPVSEARREDSSLPAPILSELASMALKVEQHFEGVPQDIEWAVADGQLWLLQSRPVTNLPPAPLKDIHWALPEDMPEWGGVLARRKLSEHLPGPVSPLFEDVYVSRAINEASMRFMEGFGFDLTGYKGHFTINGYVYMTGGRPPLKPDLTETPPRRRNPPTPAQTVAQWRGQRVPDYLAVIEQWRNIDLGATSSEQLLEGVHALADADAEYWFEGFLPVMLITRGDRRNVPWLPRKERRWRWLHQRSVPYGSQIGRHGSRGGTVGNCQTHPCRESTP